jgi:hypothetical protein
MLHALGRRVAPVDRDELDFIFRGLEARDALLEGRESG